jgi:hypothetical protein
MKRIQRFPQGNPFIQRIPVQTIKRSKLELLITGIEKTTQNISFIVLMLSKTESFLDCLREPNRKNAKKVATIFPFEFHAIRNSEVLFCLRQSVCSIFGAVGQPVF